MRMVRCFGTGRAESASASRSCAATLVADALDAWPVAASDLAAAMTRPDPSALTLTLGPICMAVNESALPPLENLITTMLGLLMTEGCSCQPSDFSDPR